MDTTESPGSLQPAPDTMYTPGSSRPAQAAPGPRKVQGQPVADVAINPLSHYYRAEVHRSISWRQRMDATTNWAILSSTALVSVAFGNPQMPHVLIPFGGIMVFLLMCIEGRRYRFYDVWRSRTRLLEAHMMVPFLLHEHTLLQGNWRETLAEDLLMPAYKMSFWAAAGSRLRRNYVWIFLILLASWVIRILIFQGPIYSFGDFYRALPIGPIPAWLILSSAAAFYGLLFLWMVLAGTSDDPDVLVYRRIQNRAATPWAR